MPRIDLQVYRLSRSLVPYFSNDVGRMILPLVPERRSITRHLQRCDSELSLSDAQAHKVSLRPFSLAVPAVVIFLRRKQAGIFLLYVNSRRGTETKVRTVLRPSIEARLQHELIVIHVAGALDRLDQVSRTVRDVILEELIAEMEPSGAGDRPARADHALLKRRRG